MSISLISFLGTIATKPDVGLGAVGTKILTLSSFVETFCIKGSESLTKKAIIHISRLGNSTSTTLENDEPEVLPKESIT